MFSNFQLEWATMKRNSTVFHSCPNTQTALMSRCEGCKQCKCSGAGEWECAEVRECPEGREEQVIGNMDDIDGALDILVDELEDRERYFVGPTTRRPLPDHMVPMPENELLLVKEVKSTKKVKDFEMEDEILALMARERRSITEKRSKQNRTVVYYHTKDELNEDTLKHQNITGTLTAKKIDPVPNLSRRTAHSNTSDSLQIEYTPRIYEQLTHNKIDITHEDKTDKHVRDKLTRVIGNYSQVSKNKDLTKLVVGEMEDRAEIIGDQKGPIISNITFQPENQTYTAMALIAGNLLYKLWNMEKDGTGDYIDTEMLRHEKISDLLEIFKEPLNINQELFLKNALDQITTALDKNRGVQNVTLCQSVEDLKNEMLKKEDENNTKPETTRDAVNNVAELMKKYEMVKDKIDGGMSKPVERQTKVNAKVVGKKPKVLTKDEKSSLNKFGKILETIAQGLLPNKNRKNFNKFNNLNVFTEDEAVKQKLKQIYNIDIGNMSITTKDKIVLDYLNHIQSKPKCLLENKKVVEPPSLEGNILLNLAEFFKIKSMTDLVKLVKVEDKVEEAITENEPEVTTTTELIEALDTFVKPKQTGPVKNRKVIKNKPSNQDTKERLKAHLKSILDDIQEIKKSSNNDSKMKEVLPCLYKVLEIGKTEQSVVKKPPKTKVNKKEKVKKIFETLKKETAVSNNRRMNTIPGPRPKSAIVWDRVITTLENKLRKNTRRTNNDDVKSIEDIKKEIKKLESVRSNSFKNYAYLHEVPPAERLLLLKTFQSDTSIYIKVLEDIKSSIKATDKIRTQDYETLMEFIDEASRNINLNEKVVKNLDKVRAVDRVDKVPNVVKETNSKLDRLTKIREAVENTSKTRKEQIINQLIKNRVMAYINMKESKGEDNNDINYDIAKKILLHLELGNNALAKEMFKIFVFEKQKGNKTVTVNKKKVGDVPKTFRPANTRFKIKEPLIKFEASDQSRLNQRDQIIKQLLNLRNIKF